mmetsp:Transcript_1980/g.3750  ORF Transcript_1980/g.3750 Transcript_1980/m.3750 type:complete len:85 (-) Transcript_1980:317-571(-)
MMTRHIRIAHTHMQHTRRCALPLMSSAKSLLLHTAAAAATAEGSSRVHLGHALFQQRRQFKRGKAMVICLSSRKVLCRLEEDLE